MTVLFIIVPETMLNKYLYIGLKIWKEMLTLKRMKEF